jgi:predicted ATPase/DNA-binding XRE family transcriptional regulator/Tfp pilus assembly protein PilF
MERSNSPVYFGEWVKRRRKILDQTQKELARLSDCSIYTVRKIETGERRPSRQLAKLLAVALKMPLEEEEIFIRAARGEIILDRLGSPSIDSPLLPVSDDQLDLFPSSVPLQSTPLIGRNPELAAMERLFKDPQCRLLSLTGMGGIGKTRLAIEFVARQRLDFSGGVCYVSLAPVKSAEAIIPVMADALQFVFSGPTDPKEQFIHYIGTQVRGTVLFVLDNLEHLLPQPASPQGVGIVGLISEFLGRLPNVKILVTSRERLNLQGEWTYELHGLAVPPSDYDGGLENYSAADLFVQSARRAKVDFEVAAEEKLAVIEICRLLDGIPLAIELAAAWVGLLTCQEIAQEIRTNIDFLTTSMLDMPERHRSIRASFDHSWKLLSGEEQDVMRKLAVFNGGFDRKAAERITGASLSLLASLVSKSLVHRTESGRYDLHQVIRQYVESHLNDDPHHLETRKRHCEYYLAYIQDREKSLRSASQQRAVRQLADEIDNIRAAWTWSIVQKNFAELGGVVRSLGWYFEIAGLYREGIIQLDSLSQALEGSIQGDIQLQRVYGLTLVQQALLYFRKGEYTQARNLYEQGLSIHRQFDDCSILAESLVFLGIIHHLTGNYDQSKELLEEALCLARGTNEKWFEGYALYNLGYIASILGHYADGLEQMLAGLNIWRSLGDPQYVALGLNFLVPTLNKLGRHNKAKEFMHESITLCEQTKNRWGLGTAYRFLGLATMAEGQYSKAQSYFRKSLEVFGEYIEGWDIARSLTYLGEAVMLAGDLSEARSIYLKALRISIESNAMPIAMDALLGFAGLAGQSGEIDFAFELCSHVMNNPASEQGSKDCAEQLCTKLTSKLTSQTAKTVRLGITTMTFDEIVKGILE